MFYYFLNFLIGKEHMSSEAKVDFRNLSFYILYTLIDDYWVVLDRLELVKVAAFCKVFNNSTIGQKELRKYNIDHWIILYSIKHHVYIEGYRRLWESGPLYTRRN